MNGIFFRIASRITLDELIKMYHNHKTTLKNKTLKEYGCAFKTKEVSGYATEMLQYIVKTLEIFLLLFHNQL